MHFKKDNYFRYKNHLLSEVYKNRFSINSQFKTLFTEY